VEVMDVVVRPVTTGQAFTVTDCKSKKKIKKEI
jgi:hypothetical protein